MAGPTPAYGGGPPHATQTGPREAVRGFRPTVGAGLGFLTLGLACLGDLWWRDATWLDDTGPGPAFFPGFLSALLVLLGAAMALGIDEAPETVAAGEDGASLQATIKFSLLLVGLIAAFPYVGGLLGLSLFVLLETLWVERRSVLISVASAVAAYCAIRLVFVVLLAVPLPPGPLRWIG
ncbi:tripartite tricarboxylate transporter TctB family protein [Prosthecomicrobium sp. N25]|uniref:tripartite tricarboxylate transporter TctB family protein n=1 Tax=Prosthecomicrobium sp. N25 TaxID=3129254 RepID=UPI003077C82C